MTFRRAVTAGAVLALATTAPVLAKSRPNQTLTVVNARAVPTTEFAVVAEGKQVATAKPIAPGKRTVLKLPKLSGCTVSIVATFADENDSSVEAFDLCQEKSVRLTD